MLVAPYLCYYPVMNLMVEMTKFFSSIFECLRELGRKTMKYLFHTTCKSSYKAKQPSRKVQDGINIFYKLPQTMKGETGGPRKSDLQAFLETVLASHNVVALDPSKIKGIFLEIGACSASALQFQPRLPQGSVPSAPRTGR